MLVENLTVGEPFGTSDHCVIKWDMVITKIKRIIVRELSLIILMWINEQLREVALNIIGVNQWNNERL